MGWFARRICRSSSETSSGTKPRGGVSPYSTTLGSMGRVANKNWVEETTPGPRPVGQNVAGAARRMPFCANVRLWARGRNPSESG